MFISYYLCIRPLASISCLHPPHPKEYNICRHRNQIMSTSYPVYQHCDIVSSSFPLWSLCLRKKRKKTWKLCISWNLNIVSTLSRSRSQWRYVKGITGMSTMFTLYWFNIVDVGMPTLSTMLTSKKYKQCEQYKLSLETEHLIIVKVNSLPHLTLSVL